MLVIAQHPRTLLGLAQAMLKFGYQIMTANPTDNELERIANPRPQKGEGSADFWSS